MSPMLIGMCLPDACLGAFREHGAAGASPAHRAAKAGCKAECFPQPDPALLAFGSASAATVSPAGFAAADRLRRRLLLTSAGEPSATVHARELERIRQELIEACGFGHLDDPDVVFAASETSLRQVSLHLTCGTTASPTRIIMVGAEEAAEGQQAAGIAGTTEVVNVPVRTADGMPRPGASVDGDVASLVNEAIAMQRRILLILTDLSPAGTRAPSASCAIALRERFPDSIHVLVDATQFRMTPSSLRGYLEAGFMVEMSGSKFLGAPGCTAALMLPGVVHRLQRRRPLPPALAQYTTRADWPSDWPGIDMLDETASLVQLLRWEAALEEMRAFRRIPESGVAHFLNEFAQEVQARLRDDPHFELLPLPVLERAGDADSWDCLPTIFPFLLRNPSGAAGRRALGRGETARIHQLLQSNLVDDYGLEFANGHRDIAMLRCLLGKPVPCGVRDGVPVSALRLCVSARMVVDAARGNGQAVIDKALSALDKTALLVRVFLYGSVF